MTKTVHQPAIARPSRRDFLRRAGAASAAMTFVAVVGFDGAAVAQTQAFRIDVPEGIWVSMTNGRKFDVVVTDSGGVVVEQHLAINVNKLMRLDSAYLTVTPITPGT